MRPSRRIYGQRIKATVMAPDAKWSKELETPTKYAVAEAPTWVWWKRSFGNEWAWANITVQICNVLPHCGALEQIGWKSSVGMYDLETPSVRNWPGSVSRYKRSRSGIMNGHRSERVVNLERIIEEAEYESQKRRTSRPKSFNNWGRHLQRKCILQTWYPQRSNHPSSVMAWQMNNEGVVRTDGYKLSLGNADVFCFSKNVVATSNDEEISITQWHFWHGGWMLESSSPYTEFP